MKTFFSYGLPWFVSFLLIMISSCREQEISIPDVRAIEVSPQVHRMDSTLFAVQDVQEMRAWQSAYPAFYDLYFGQILRLPSMQQDSLVRIIQQMRQAETFTNIHRLVQDQYASTHALQKSWHDIMQYYHYYFPSADVPDLYTMVSEFALASFLFSDESGHDAIGVSLDMFLGDSAQYHLLSRMDPAFSSYNSRTFNQDHLMTRAVEALILDRLAMPSGQIFLDHLLREGKKYYALSRILPHTPDTVIWGFTTDQMSWVRDNEWNIYAHLIDHEMFFAPMSSQYSKLLGPAPTSAGMPPESPGRAVAYIGYQIIKAYVAKTDTPLEEVLEDADARKIFNMAAYRPPR